MARVGVDLFSVVAPVENEGPFFGAEALFLLSKRENVGDCLREVFMDLQPLGDRLIVEVLAEEEITVGGIVLPDTAREKPQRGRVLAVGPGARDEEGRRVEMEVVEGDEVIFSKYGGTEIKLGGDEVLILRESDVLAKVAPRRSRRKRALAGATSQ